MISVDEREEIRRAHLIEGDSLRKIEREKGYSRRTIHKALGNAEDGEDRPGGERGTGQGRESPVLGPYKAKIEALLEESRRLPRKQRYTGHQIYKQIQAQGYSGSESGVHVYMWRRRGEERRPEIFLPLGFEPGQDGQVDFGEAVIELNGERETAQFIEVRLNYSRKPFVRAYPTQKQECFFEGQAAAFTFFGGVPYRLSYDNLKAAVLRVLKGRARAEQRRFTAFRSHHLFEAHFCTPGQGHEKGGVENGIGYAQRNLFVPLIKAGSWDEVNAQLLKRCRSNKRVNNSFCMPIHFGSRFLMTPASLPRMHAATGASKRCSTRCTTCRCWSSARAHSNMPGPCGSCVRPGRRCMTVR